MGKTDAEKMTTLFEFSATSAKIMAISGLIPASLGQNRPISSIKILDNNPATIADS